MQFLKNFLLNLFWLIVLCVVVYVIYPDIMGMVYKLFGQLFGPLAILIIVAAALPRRRTRS